MNNTPLPTCPKILKWIFVFFNFLFAILGILLIALGSWMVASGNSFLNALGSISTVVQGTVLAAGALIILCGLITFVVAALGVLGGICQARPLLVIFAVGLIIIVLIEFIGAIVAFAANALSPGLVNSATDEMQANLILYRLPPVNEAANRFFDTVQNTFDCCGITNSSNWVNTPVFNDTNGNFPPSCCAGQINPCSPSSTALHTTGCIPAIENFITTNRAAAVVLGVIALLVLLVEISGIFIACGLCCCIRSAKLTLV